MIKACFAPFTNPTSSHVFDNDELKAFNDNIQRFLELSRQIESYFINKRAVLATLKPELILTEEINDLKAEITRKDFLLNKYNEKLNKWTSIINDTSNGKIHNPANIPMVPTQQMMQGPMRMGQPMQNMNKMKMQPGTNINSSMMHSGSPMMNQIRQQGSSMVSSQIPPSMGPVNPNHGGLHGPLAFLERTTCNIGMNESRR